MPSNKSVKTIAITLAAALTLSAALPVATANAGGKHKGELLAAGVIGLALGAIIADSSNHRQRRADRIYYNQQAYIPPAYIPPRPVVRYNDPDYMPYPDSNYTPGQYYDDSYRDTPARYNQPRDIAPPRHYQQVYQPATPVQRTEPKVITYNPAPTYDTQPWSDGWRSYCTKKFRSFDAGSGTYLGYDGKRHFCVVK